MTQRPSDLLAALKNKGVKRIKAHDTASAIDVIEGRMGQCWKEAYGSRHVARQMLRDEFVPIYRRTSSLTKKPVPKKYSLKEGEKIIMVVVGYRPKTAAERQELASRAELKRVRREAEKGRPRYHRTKKPVQSIATVKPIKVKRQRFSQFLTPKKIRKFGIGNLSVG